MFTGIIEALGTIEDIKTSGSNLSFIISSPISQELKPDQSVSHDGICLTVEAVNTTFHTVTAIAETLDKTNLSGKKIGDVINLERCLQFNGRVDGHLVQGHVDGKGHCIYIDEKDGSTEYTVSYDPIFAHLLVEKGSICLNGISLTAFNVQNNQFTVAIIPYTNDHTNIGRLKLNDEVNLEFDIIGKYIARNVQIQSV